MASGTVSATLGMRFASFTNPRFSITSLFCRCLACPLPASPFAYLLLSRLINCGSPLSFSFSSRSEAPLVVAAAKLGMWRDEMLKKYPRVDEIPFNSSRKVGIVGFWGVCMP